MPITQYPDGPELAALQEEKDKTYKEMLLYKDQLLELKGSL